MEVEGDGGEEGVTVCGTLREAPAGSEPTAVAVDTCEDVGASEGRQTLKEKPGMRAVHKGATLLLDTTRHGSRQLRLGFLQTYSSRAVARLSCTPPCTCAVTDVSAHADSRTSLTAYANVPGGFASPPDRTRCGSIS